MTHHPRPLPTPHHPAPCGGNHHIPRPERPAHTASVLFLYRNFRLRPDANLSHVGLGVSASHIARLLHAEGVHTDVAGAWDPAEVAVLLRNRPYLTHVVVEAPWIPLAVMNALLGEFPGIEFVVRCHSQLAFLQVDPGAFALMRGYLALQRGGQRIRIAGNATRFTHAMSALYGPCLYLPNGYFLDGKTPRNRSPNLRGTIRVGSFGATRVLKNHLTSAAAALIAAKDLGVDLEFYVSTGRTEGGGSTLLALREMFAGLPTARLVEAGWQGWTDFVNLTEAMDCMMQLSFTESFNIVTADGIAHGVPSVVGPAIEWTPPSWRADPDDAIDAAKVLRHLLHDHRAAAEGMEALKAYNLKALCAWLEYLDADPRARHRP